MLSSIALRRSPDENGLRTHAAAPDRPARNASASRSRRRITGGALCSLPAKASRTARVTAMPPIDPTWKSTITASGGSAITASATARGSLISVIV